MNIKELVIISGKGGTGKTTLTAALSYLFTNKVMADCDVDASNLNVSLNSKIIKEEKFSGGKKAQIDEDKCTECGVCTEFCRFDAISEDFKVNPFKCEGCGGCYYLCPEDAVQFLPADTGIWYQGVSEDGTEVVFAEMFPGEENSGKLVTVIKNEARDLAEKIGKNLILVDGPPGIACPVISSLSGADASLIVTEPTTSGIHDMKRILELSDFFKIKSCIVINKYDINEKQTEEIERFAEEKNISVLGKIPYDSGIADALREGKNIMELNNSVSINIRDIYKKLNEYLEID